MGKAKVYWKKRSAGIVSNYRQNWQRTAYKESYLSLHMLFSILFFEIRVGENQVGTDINGKPGAWHLGRASNGSLIARLTLNFLN
jgi:hypothetical protein